jgi:hypothetical protein
VHGYLRAVCDDQEIEYSETATINGLFNLLRQHHPAFQKLGTREQDIVTVMKSLSAIMDALTPLRNNASMAHPTKKLLAAPEALLIVNAAKTIVNYLDAKLDSTEDE